jgi:hypothetical protein
MDAYEISHKIKELWAENVPKNSGQIDKGNTRIGVYCNTPHGIWKLSDVSYDENFGIMLNVKVNDGKEE